MGRTSAYNISSFSQKIYQTIRERAMLALIVSSYIALLHLAYTYVISPRWAYLGYVYYAPGPALSIHVALALLPVLWMPVAFNRPSSVIYWFLYLSVVIPVALIPAYLKDFISQSALLISFTVVFAFALLGVIYLLPLINIPPLRFSRTIFLGVLSLLALALSAFGVIHAGFDPPSSLFSEDVYVRRLEAREVFGSRVLGYMAEWAQKVLDLVLMSWGVVYASLPLFAIGIVGQVLWFGVQANKMIVLSPILILGLYFLLSKSSRRFGIVLSLAFAAVVSFSLGVDVLLGGDKWLLTSLFVRRMIVTPGLLTAYYFDFFSLHPPAQLAHSVLAGFVESHYDASLAFIIGEEYFRNPNTSANANLWADGFANFRIAGVFGATLLLAAFLWIYDSLAVRKNKLLAALLLAVPGYSLVNSAVLTTFLTHGLVLTAVLLWLCPCTRGVAWKEQSRQ